MTGRPLFSKPWTGRGVILGFIAFFVVLIAVQAVFIATAISTHTGLVSKQPYRKGLNYGARIEESEKQKERGWQETWTLSEQKDRLTLRLADRDGAPVQDLFISGELARPVHKNEDRLIEFKQSSTDDYVVDFKEPLIGSYIVDVLAKRKDDLETVVWRTRRRLWIKP